MIEPAPESATTRQSPLTTSRTVPSKLSCSLAVAVWGGVQLCHMPARREQVCGSMLV